MPDLTGLTALDVAIGLAFLFFLLSIVCSAIMEAIASVFKLRAKDLERGLRQLLADGQEAKETRAQIATELRDFFDKPRVRALVDPPRWWRKPRRPSYIPARVFALTLLDTFAPSTDGADNRDILARARDSVATIENSTVQTMVADAIAEAQYSVLKFRQAIERSFDEVMDRVSGWYKRRAQLILAAIAVVVAMSVNADSFTIGERLWKDDALRAAVVAQAQRQEDATSCKQQDDAEQTPVDRAAECVDRVEELGLPVGWTDDTTPDSVAGWLGKVGGLLVTAFALTLGAPFWFDLLGKFARLRSTGRREGTEKTDRGAVDRDDMSRV